IARVSLSRAAGEDHPTPPRLHPRLQGGDALLHLRVQGPQHGIVALGSTAEQEDQRRRQDLHCAADDIVDRQSWEQQTARPHWTWAPHPANIVVMSTKVTGALLLSLLAGACNGNSGAPTIADAAVIPDPRSNADAG